MKEKCPETLVLSVWVTARLGGNIAYSYRRRKEVEERIGKSLGCPVRMWGRTKIEWFFRLKTKGGRLQLLKSRLLQELRTKYMQKEDFEGFCLAQKKYA